jgi:hypothetical protein
VALAEELGQNRSEVFHRDAVPLALHGAQGAVRERVSHALRPAEQPASLPALARRSVGVLMAGDVYSLRG